MEPRLRIVVAQVMLGGKVPKVDYDGLRPNGIQQLGSTEKLNFPRREDGHEILRRVPVARQAKSNQEGKHSTQGQRQRSRPMRPGLVLGGEPSSEVGQAKTVTRPQ